MVSVCTGLAQLATGERERAFPPARRPGDVTHSEVTDLPAPISEARQAHLPALPPRCMDWRYIWASLLFFREFVSRAQRSCGLTLDIQTEQH